MGGGEGGVGVWGCGAKSKNGGQGGRGGAGVGTAKGTFKAIVVTPPPPTNYPSPESLRHTNQ